MIKAIETVYKNYHFRSRLEAQWAAFFDLVNWTWEYEPVDFNGWIPDFAIYGKDIVYVEVKPVVELPQDVCRKIDNSGCDKEVLLVGQANPLPPGDDWHNQIGWLREGGYEEAGKPVWWWQSAYYGRWIGSESEAKNRKGLIGFCPEYGFFMDRITGCYDGGSFGEGEVESSEIKRFWSQAKNLTQWQPPKSDIPI